PTRSKILLGNFRDSFFAESDRLRAIERIVGDRRGNWDYKETPSGAQEKADSAFQRAVEEAQRMIDQAGLDLSEALERLDEAEQQLQDIQQMIEDLDLTGVLKESEYYNGVRISDELGLEVVRSDGLVRTVLNATQGIAIQTRDSTTDDWLSVFFVNPFNRRLTFDGDILARNITLAGNVVAQNAMITGTLIGSAATLQSVDVRNANIINANIQQATITGTLNGVNGTFVGTLSGVRGTFDELETSWPGPWGLVGAITLMRDTDDFPLLRVSDGASERSVNIKPGYLYIGPYVRNPSEVSAFSGFIEFTATPDVRGVTTPRYYNHLYAEGNLRIEATAGVDIYGGLSVRNFGLSTDTIRGNTNTNRITFGSSNNMVLTSTDTYPHYGLILGQVMVKGLASATQQVQIRDRNDTAYRDLAVRDLIVNNMIYVSGTNTGYMHFRSTQTYGYLYCPGGNSYVRLASNGEV